MARFQMELPTEIMKDFDKIYGNTDQIFGEMTKAGAEEAMNEIQSNVPEAIRNSEMMKCLKLSGDTLATN